MSFDYCDIGLKVSISSWGFLRLSFGIFCLVLDFNSSLFTFKSLGKIDCLSIVFGFSDSTLGVHILFLFSLTYLLLLQKSNVSYWSWVNVKCFYLSNTVKFSFYTSCLTSNLSFSEISKQVVIMNLNCLEYIGGILTILI